MRRLSVATAAAAAALLMSGCVVYPSHGYRHVSGGPVYRDYDQRTYQPDRPYDRARDRDRYWGYDRGDRL